MPLFNPSGNIVSASGNTEGALATYNSGSIVLAGGNNITLSQNSNSISIIGAAGGTGGAAITLGGSNLGNTSGTSGVISGSALQFLLAGGNNVTLSQSLNGSSITVTVSAANQTVQSVGLYAVSNTTLSTSHTADARSLSFAGDGIVSVGASNGSVQISASQSAQSLGLYASSQTTGQSSSSTVDARSLTVVGAGGVSAGLSGGSLVISGGAGGGGGNNTLGMSNLGNTAGTSGVISGSAVELYLAGGNNVTLSQSINGSTATITVSVGNAAGQTNQTGNVYASSNTFGTSSGTYDARTLSIAGSGAASVAASNSGWVVSVPAFTTITQGNMVTISTAGSSMTIDAFANILSASGNTSGTLTTFSSGTMVLAGGNNITLSQSSNTITISAGAGGGGTNVSAYAVSNTTLSTSATIAQSAFSFEGAGAASVGISNGSVVVSAPAQTNQTIGAYAVSNTTLSTSHTLDARSLSFAGDGIASVGVSNGSVQISVPAQSNQTGNLYASSNTFGTSSGTYNASAISIAGSGAVSVAASNSGWVISAPAQTNQSLGIYAGSNTTVSTSGTVDARSLSVAGAGGVSVEASNSGFTVSAPVQSYLIAGNNISLSSNSNSITIADLLSTGQVSQFEPWEFGPNTSASSLGQSSLYFQHMVLPELQVCRMDRLISLSLNAAVSGSSNATGTRSNVWNYNETVGLFTRGTGTNSTNLYSYLSNSWSFGITESVSIITVGGTDAEVNQSYSLGFVGNIDTNGGSTSSTFTSASSSSSLGTSVSQANVISNVSGLLVAQIPFGSAALTGGDYWLAVVGRSAVTSGGTATTLASVSNVILTAFNNNLQQLGKTITGTSNTLIPGDGVFTAQTSAFPSSVAINAIGNNSNASLYGNLMNLSM